MTQQKTSPRRVTGSVVMAAMALPGVWAGHAQAENAPEKGLMGFKYLRYQDSQAGTTRVTVDAPAFHLLTPLSSKWAVDGSIVADSLSGATPREHTFLSGATMSDLRTAGDMKVTYFGRRSSYSLGSSYSTENDYTSLAFSANASFSTENNNTTVSFGYGHAEDKIVPSELTFVDGQFVQLDERKATNEFLLALTQVTSPRDLFQFNLTVSDGEGFFSDPYKFAVIDGAITNDNRPRERTQTAFLARWNHHFAGLGATVKPSYRYYVDTFGVQANTWQLEWAQRLGANITVTPLLRYYTQRAADFYSDPDPNDPNLSVAPNQEFYSVDQRLAAFGAITLGLRADMRLGAGWSFDLKAEGFEQRAEYRIGGEGSPGLEPMRATFFQVGINRTF
jgi:hypothetical protein